MLIETTPDGDLSHSQALLEAQLRAAKLSCLELRLFKHYNVKGILFEVFTGVVCFNNQSIADAWFIKGGGITEVYNQSNYPTTNEAVERHVGNLICSGRYDITPTKRRTSRENTNL